jgi:cyclic pyranopterin phosphate synthase
MIDPFGRHITYLRVSVTDRCDFRCVYCMAEDMTFLPKAEVLSLEELERLCSAFVRRGVKKLRMTGGEPLVRKNVMSLFRGLGRHLESGALEELTLTTNGSQLAKYARELADIGVKRVNVSMDTLDATKFRELTRWGDLGQVMRGLDAAQNAGLAIKINAVALRGVNDMEFDDLIRFSHGRGMDLVLIRRGSTSTCRCRWRGPTSQGASPSARPTIVPAVRHAISRSKRPAAGWASSPRSPTISAKAAIACD